MRFVSLFSEFLSIFAQQSAAVKSAVDANYESATTSVGGQISHTLRRLSHTRTIIPSGDKSRWVRNCAAYFQTWSSGFKVLKTIGNAFQSTARKIERGSGAREIDLELESTRTTRRILGRAESSETMQDEEILRQSMPLSHLRPINRVSVSLSLSFSQICTRTVAL